MFVNEAWSYSKAWLGSYKLWKCQQITKDDGSKIYDFPEVGVYNLATQIIDAILEESKRRHYPPCFSWLADFQKRAVLARVGITPEISQVSQDKSKQLLIGRNPAPLLITHKASSKKPTSLTIINACQIAYTWLRKLFRIADQSISHALKL